MVVDIKSRISLFVFRLSHLTNKEGKTVMLIGGIDIARLMTYVQHIEGKKLKDRGDFCNKKGKTFIYDTNKRGVGNESRPAFQLGPSKLAPSFARAPASKIKNE